jgi:membrane associated rhomboid family serine protease
LAVQVLAFGPKTLHKEAMVARFWPILALTALCWLTFAVDHFVLHDSLLRYGIIPRQLASLPAILWAPLLHVSFQHLAANTGPLLILGGVLSGRSRTEFFMVTVAGTLLGGALTWLVARNGVHVGASGLLFCFFGYLASLALFRRTFGTLALSLICIIAYGGISRGILPTTGGISWEGHACGLAAGIALSWMGAQFNRAEPGSALKPPEFAGKNE